MTLKYYLYLMKYYKEIYNIFFIFNFHLIIEQKYILNKVYPKIFIGYDRKSYKGKDNDKLRITFDCNLRSRRDNLRLENGSNGDLFL